MTTASALHTVAATAADGLRMFGWPWWFPLTLLPPFAAVLFALVGKLRQRRDAEGSDDRRR